MPDEDAYGAYHHDDGQPRLVPSRVLFFDLLGIKEMATGEHALEALRRLRPTLKAAVDRAMTEDRSMRQASTWFTDNAVVAAPLDAQFSEALLGTAEISAAYLQLICWEEGFLGRGAISVGLHYMDESFVYGPALVEAANLEKRTRWPRVTLGATAVDLERLHSGYYGNALSSAQARCLVRDAEDAVFVDSLGIYIDEEDNQEVLDYHLSRLRDATVAALDSMPRYSEPWLKWRWLAAYQNWALKSRLRDPSAFLVPVEDRPTAFATFLDLRPDTEPGSPWFVMDRMDRYRLDQADDPPVAEGAGVYAVYDSQHERLFVGCAARLMSRVRADLGRTPATAVKSPLARAVLEHLGIATASDIAQGRHLLTRDDLRRLESELSRFSVADCETESLKIARALMREMLHEFVPPLNRIQ